MKIIFARYNRHRLKPFQVETSIVALNGSRMVMKKALTPEAAAHIRAMRAELKRLECIINDSPLGEVGCHIPWLPPSLG